MFVQLPIIQSQRNSFFAFKAFSFLKPKKTVKIAFDTINKPCHLLESYSFGTTVKFKELQYLKVALKTVDKKDPGVSHNDIMPMFPVKLVIWVHLCQGEITQLLKGCVWYAHRIQEADLSSQTCFRLACRRIGPRTEGRGEQESVGNCVCGHTQLLPAITGKKRSPIPTHSLTRMDKKIGKELLKNHMLLCYLCFVI